MKAKDSSLEKKAIKAAKKHLKGNLKDGKMKLKALSKLVAERLAEKESDITHKQVKAWIQKKSEKFVVDGKYVSLKGSSSSSGSNGDNNDGSNKRTNSPTQHMISEDDSGAESPAKKARKGQSTDKVGDVTAWRSDNRIVVMATRLDEDNTKEAKEIESKLTKGINANTRYDPFQSFDDSRCADLINASLLRQCTDANKFTKPSPIQAQSWPILMAKDDFTKTKMQDLVGIAETGSGKTLAFSIPALSSMAASSTSKKPRRSPRMLVLSPTRELAMQSQDVLEEFGAVVGLRSVVLYGGVPKHAQIGELKKRNVDCVVATPGRIKDLINDGSCDLSQIEHLVLDEADRMLDMGFEEDVRYIISQCKQTDRQTAMFSATWPAAIQKIAMEYMSNPIRVYVGFEAIVGSNGENQVDDSLSANKRVQQTVEVIEDRAREQRLRALLKQHQKDKQTRKPQRILVFALYKKEAERLEFSLRRDGFDVCSIHGNKNQQSRTAALADFKSGKCPLLVATDVAARGLDIPNVEVVINFTFPLTIEDYVHRIGRTGRAGKTGISITFFQPTDKSHAGELQQVMRQAGQHVPESLMKFGSTIKKKEHKLYGNFGPTGGGPMKKATKITFNYSDDEE